MPYHFTQFDIWNKSMNLAKSVHELTKTFPKEEIFALTSQMRRASLSVPANIAEGLGRYTFADKKHKYVQARGELVEVMTFLHHAESIRYIDLSARDALLALSEDIYRMLNSMIAKMNNRKS